ncbi:cupin domain-containing protein [Actinokineospora sp. NBRC 105648]|uniref:cupin domain-containing protein n=1 Tax=Actinokineospora sp. NBRC 105648 TaxID=3032206 RepID=UPI0024A10B6E|nr:cupin domain-containing protein [Actinokineospora sp. NBRC 105648]GLZ39321.1 cupin [Actinokineospora sp. NBRC 105648]
MRVIDEAGCLDALEPLPPKYQAHFTGLTGLHDLFPSEQPHTVSVLMVRFEAGARNNWHWHRGGQMLYITEGEGYVQVRGEQPRLIRAGDVVCCPPGEEHWHGASPNSPMTHLAVTLGEIVWLEPSTPDLAGR